jgi:hypothetical protein
MYRFEKERAHWRMQASDQDHHDLRTLTWRSRKTLQVVSERDMARSRVSELEGHLSSLSVHYEHEHPMNILSAQQPLKAVSEPMETASSFQGKRETGAHFLESPL